MCASVCFCGFIDRRSVERTYCHHDDIACLPATTQSAQSVHTCLGSKCVKGKPTSKLRSAICHMGSHCITRQPTQMNSPRLSPIQTGRCRGDFVAPGKFFPPPYCHNVTNANPNPNPNLNSSPNPNPKFNPIFNLNSNPYSCVRE